MKELQCKLMLLTLGLIQLAFNVLCSLYTLRSNYLYFKDHRRIYQFFTDIGIIYPNIAILSQVEQVDDFIFSNRKCPSTSTKEQHLSHPMNAGRLDRLLSYSKAISYCNVLTSAPLVYAMTHSMCYPICHVWNREQSVAVGHTERGSL